ncbi:MAG TPA: YceI family protein [Candidatus Dormibacteraeota bacterium]|nr:YceI family protein [Candidatus Dormibacteraeota bacterium]
MHVLRRLVPHTLRSWILSAVAAVLLLGAAAFAFLWFVVFGTSSPPPLTLSTATPSGSAQASPVDASQLPGTWSSSSGSVVGYRVREQLAFLSAPSDAVGRTSKVSGSATLGGTTDALTVTAASFQADVSTLSSDRTMRDDRIHSIGLESSRFPTAGFVLTQPATLAATAAGGQTVKVDLSGNLTIHGVTKLETIPAQAHLSATEVEVVGSITFPWGDFGMRVPNVGGFVSVTDQATMEFDLHLRHG